MKSFDAFWENFVVIDGSVSHHKAYLHGGCIAASLLTLEAHCISCFGYLPCRPPRHVNTLPRNVALASWGRWLVLGIRLALYEGDCKGPPVDNDNL